MRRRSELFGKGQESSLNPTTVPKRKDSSEGVLGVIRDGGTPVYVSGWDKCCYGKRSLKYERYMGHGR